MEIDELCTAVEAWRSAKQPNHEDFCAQMAVSASVNLEEYITKETNQLLFKEQSI
jgi:hypothetical protein